VKSNRRQEIARIVLLSLIIGTFVISAFQPALWGQDDKTSQPDKTVQPAKKDDKARAGTTAKGSTKKAPKKKSKKKAGPPKQDGMERALEDAFGAVNGFLISILFRDITFGAFQWEVLDEKTGKPKTAPVLDDDGNPVMGADGKPKTKPVMTGPTLPFVVGVLVLGSVFFTFYYGFINVRGFKHSINVIRGKYDDPNDEGEISHFRALTSALSATVGLGNIAGVAIAVTTGGPGAVFWMMALAVFGMTAKFSECTLAQMYRKKNPDGSISGGPMYYLDIGLNEKGALLGKIGKGLAVMFALMCIGGALGGGNMFQANQSYEAFSSAFGIQAVDSATGDFNPWPARGFGIIMAVMVGLVILGGIKRIGATTSRIVPFMCGLYVIASLLIILTNLGKVPQVIAMIFNEAFTAQAAYGGFIGVLVMGFKRAAFSNEAGLGSAAIAHSAAKTNEPVREGIVAMIGPFIDTVVICLMTALVVLITGSYTDPALVIGGEAESIRVAQVSKVSTEYGTATDHAVVELDLGADHGVKVDMKFLMHRGTKPVDGTLVITEVQELKSFGKFALKTKAGEAKAEDGDAKADAEDQARVQALKDTLDQKLADLMAEAKEGKITQKQFDEKSKLFAAQLYKSLNPPSYANMPKAGDGALASPSLIEKRPATLWRAKLADVKNQEGVTQGTIKMGSQDGVVRKMRFYTYRDGEYLGTLAVAKVTALESTVTDPLGEMELTEGDLMLGAIEKEAGAAVTVFAFGKLASWFPYVLSVCIILFAFSTMISWCYYGERAWGYLFGFHSLTVFRLVFVFFVFIGSVLKLGNVLLFSDLMILCMAFPNIVGSMFLISKVKTMLRDYWGRYTSGEMKTHAEMLAAGAGHSGGSAVESETSGGGEQADSAQASEDDSTNQT